MRVLKTNVWDKGICYYLNITEQGSEMLKAAYVDQFGKHLVHPTSIKGYGWALMELKIELQEQGYNLNLFYEDLILERFPVEGFQRTLKEFVSVKLVDYELSVRYFKDYCEVNYIEKSKADEFSKNIAIDHSLKLLDDNIKAPNFKEAKKLILNSFKWQQTEKQTLGSRILLDCCTDIKITYPDETFDSSLFWLLRLYKKLSKDEILDEVEYLLTVHMVDKHKFIWSFNNTMDENVQNSLSEINIVQLLNYSRLKTGFYKNKKSVPHISEIKVGDVLELKLIEENETTFAFVSSIEKLNDINYFNPSEFAFRIYLTDINNRHLDLIFNSVSLFSRRRWENWNFKEVEILSLKSTLH